MRPLILITNDDGVFSPGLCAAAEAVHGLGDLLIVAPRFQQTSMGRSFPKGEDVGIIERVRIAVNGYDTDAYGVHGSPAYAVAHGVLELASRKPDLCISGVNYGENLGLCLTCSGTLGAAFEADSHDIPSIAVSRQVELDLQHSSDYGKLDWKLSKWITRKLAQEILEHGMPENTSILNVNIPDGATENIEIRTTRQCRSNYSVFQKPKPRDFGQSHHLKARIEVDPAKLDRHSDVYAFYIDKAISITPLTWNLTAETAWSYERSCLVLLKE